MIRPLPEVRAFLYNQPVDMRKSINGLAAIVDSELELNLLDKVIFVFMNRQRDKIKLLYWENNGFVLWYKRLEKHRFSQLPPAADPDTITMTGEGLNQLLDGFDIFNYRPHASLNYTDFS